MDPHKTRGDWASWPSGRDYYEENALVWLEADALIRERAAGTRSLDDFARAFFGMEDGHASSAPLAGLGLGDSYQIRS